MRFIPTAAFLLFQVELESGYGFRLETNFVAGQEIVFDCATGDITIAGLPAYGIQTAGSIFNLDSGVNVLSVKAAAGTLGIYWRERFI
jgi:hypothetical protein